MLVLGDTGVAVRGDEAKVLQGIKGLADGLLVQVEDGVARGALIAGVDQGVDRERIILRRGDLFFDQGAEDAKLDVIELHSYKSDTGWFCEVLGGIKRGFTGWVRDDSKVPVGV